MSRGRPRLAPRGFTLVELMIVVAIIGILASIAIPTFGKFTLRSKAAERALVLDRIKKALEDKLVRDGRIADTGWLFGNYNPSYPPTTTKRPADFRQAGWNQLDVDVEGNLYYSYMLMAWGNGAGETVFSFAVGDLDGDRLLSWKQRLWVTGSTGLQPYPWWPPEWRGEYPPAGQEDDAGPYRTF